MDTLPKQFLESFLFPQNIGDCGIEKAWCPVWQAEINIFITMVMDLSKQDGKKIYGKYSEVIKIRKN